MSDRRERLYEQMRERAEKAEAERDALREDLTRCERRLVKTNDDRAHWRERARSAEQALGLYGPAVTERPE